MIISADYEKLCGRGSFDYLSVVVVAEIVVLVVVVSKVWGIILLNYSTCTCHIAQLVYDVVMYKRTGELPWLARHICLGYSYAGLAKVRDA